MWVRNLMREASDLLGNQRALAEVLGVTQPNIGAYISGKQTPSINIIEKLLSHFGGDISKALPKKLVPQPKEKPLPPQQRDNQIYISGQVSAGRVTFAGDDSGYRDVDGLWHDSKYWGLTTGPVVYIEVQGESMSPEYKLGEVLACRRPCDPKNLPNGTPCIFQEGDEDNFTFKILRMSDDGQIIGQPLNPDYPMVIFNRKTVKVSHVVLGKVQLEKRDINGALLSLKNKHKKS